LTPPPNPPAAPAPTPAPGAAAVEESPLLKGIRLPAAADDKEALVQWAYNEATLLIRQYGSLIETVSDYIQSGTASIGEIAVLIEEELR